MLKISYICITNKVSDKIWDFFGTSVVNMYKMQFFFLHGNKFIHCTYQFYFI